MTDEEFQDLKRENFNLKLRIYFLEEQTQVSVNDNEYQTETSYIQQLQNEIEGLRRRLQSQSGQTTYNFNYDDERRALREELEKFRRENELLRKSLQLNSNKIHGDEREKFTTTASVDSGLGTVTPGMSSTFTSSNALQYELNESKERERKLEEKVVSLRKQLESSIPQTNETLVELERARRQIRQYEVDIKNYEQQQSKAERVLQRLQTEYESRIAHLVEQQQQQIKDYENYQHEPLLARIRFTYPLQDQPSSNVNIEEYRQAIDNRDRIIQQLEKSISEITIRLRTPFKLMFPSQVSSSDWKDEQSQTLIHELNAQTKIHLETIDQLRAECVELRRGETHLRNQIDSLTHLINAPTRNPGLPSQPRPSSKINDLIDDAQQIEDLQTAVVQITLQLQSDAENVSSLTYRVAQIIRDRDEWQDKINQLQEEIQEKNAQIRQLEKREPEVESRIRQQFSLQIEILQRDIKSLQDQLNDRDRIVTEIKTEKQEIQLQTRRDYEKFDHIHIQEKQNLQGQLQTANQRLIDYEQELANERRRFDDLQIKYENIQLSNRTQAAQLELEIQQQRTYIEEFNLQIREIENNFQKERRQLEREKDFEKEKNLELQNTFEITKTRFSELQIEYNRLQSVVDEQQDKFDQQIRIYQNQIAQFDREKDRSNDEIQNLIRENQINKDRWRETENKIIDLTRKNDEFKSQISVYEIRFQDNEDIDKRHRNEINKLQRDIEDISRENQNNLHELNEWRHKYEIIKTDLNNSYYEKQTIQSENQTVNNENTKLKHDIDQLAIQIRLQIQQEYEEEYQKIIINKEKDVENIQKDTEAIRSDLEQLNNERTRLQDRLHIVEINLKQANETIENYETDIDRLRQALTISKEKNEQIEYDLSRAYTDELKMKTDRLQDLENKYRLTETQLNNLRHENGKLIENNERLQHEYTEYRFEQQNNYDTLQKNVDAATQKNLTAFEERIRTEVIQTTENNQTLIDRLENELREKNKIIEELKHARSSYKPKDLQLELEIRIEQLEQEVEIKERFIKNYSETVHEKEQQIEKLLDDIQQGGSNNTSIIETLREELQSRERRINQLLNEKNSDIDERDRQISELQIIIRERQREINNTNDKFQQSEQRFDIQQRDLEDYRQKRDILTVDLNIAIEENQAHLDRIKILEEQLEMLQNRNPTPDQLAHFQGIIDDLKFKLRQRDDSIQSLQHTIADSDRDLKETRHNHNTIQSDYNRTQLRYEQMEKQHSNDLDYRDQTIASLRKKITEKDEEINKLRDDDINKEALISKLRSKSRESDQDSRSEYSGARAPTNVSLRLEIQKKDEQIDELQRQLDRARRDKSPIGRDDSSVIQHAERVEIRRRPLSKNFDHLNREELLYELEMALQDNEGLIQQLAKTSLNKKDSGVESVVESTRYTLTQQEYQRRINDKDDQIRQLTKQFNDLKKVHENEINQYRLKSEKAQTDLIDDLDSKQNDLRQARLQIDLLKSTKTQLEQAQDQNQRLHVEIKLIQNELTNKKDLIIHYEKQISLLERQISSRDGGKGEMSVRTSEMSELLEEMRRLRHDLERSINKQNELQAKLDENLRLTRTPREFTFSGRGVSYPDLRITEGSGLIGAENLSFTSVTDERRSRPLGLSVSGLEAEQINPGKMYIVGELEQHENLRQLIADIKIELKALEVKLQEKLRLKFTSSLTEPSIEWLEHRLKSLTQCLQRLEETYQLIESYWKANLPFKNKYDEHPYNDPRLASENKELKILQTKYVQEIHQIKQKYKEQSIYMDQVLAQLTSDQP